MNVILKREFYGHCPGLQRSLRLADALLKKAKSEDKIVYYDVPLSHNEDATRKLEERGMKFVALDRVHNGELNYFLISAHGASSQKIKLLAQKNFIVQDATCPIVDNLQKQVVADYELGYQVVIFGKRGHPEIEGVDGSIGNSAIIIKSDEEAALLKLDKPTSIVCQTTFSSSDFERIAASLKEKFSDLSLVVRNTVCPIVKRRVQSIIDYVEENPTDVVIVVGSSTSSNTKLLARKIEEHAPTTMVDNAENIRKIDFNAAENVLVVSGTSAPPEIVEEVGKRIQSFESED